MKRKRGRPTLKTEERIRKSIELARNGKNQREIAEIVGVKPNTISTWKEKDLEFSIALRENQAIADDMVEASLFKRATGYDYTEEFATREGIQELRKHAPPDSGSIQFWLRNRRPDDWKDRQEIEHKVIPGWGIGLGAGTKEDL